MMRKSVVSVNIKGQSGEFPDFAVVDDAYIVMLPEEY